MDRRDRLRVYVGGLPDNADKLDLETEFSKFGRLRDVWIARKPPGFAFIEFDDDNDARDAVRELDGREICGNRVRVELARGSRRGGGGGGRYGERRDRDRGRHDREDDYRRSSRHDDHDRDFEERRRRDDRDRDERRRDDRDDRRRDDRDDREDRRRDDRDDRRRERDDEPRRGSPGGDRDDYDRRD